MFQRACMNLCQRVSPLLCVNFICVRLLLHIYVCFSQLQYHFMHVVCFAWCDARVYYTWLVLSLLCGLVNCWVVLVPLKCSHQSLAKLSSIWLWHWLISGSALINQNQSSLTDVYAVVACSSNSNFQSSPLEWTFTKHLLNLSSYYPIGMNIYRIPIKFIRVATTTNIYEVLVKFV